MGLMQMRMNLVARYVNVLALIYFFHGGPLPGYREGLIALAMFTIAVSVGVQIYVGFTGNYRMAGYLLLGLDIVTILPAIYFTGMVASPIIVLLPMSLFSTFFIDRNARVTVMFGLFAVFGYVLLGWMWWHARPDSVAWNPRVFPGFTLFAFTVQTTALFVATYQASFLPNPMLVELTRQEAILDKQANAAELGVSMAMVVHELRTPLTSIGGRLELAQDRLAQGTADAPAYAARSVELAMEEVRRMGRMLEHVLAYGRDRRGVTKREPVDLAEAVDRAVEFVRLKHGRHKARCQVAGRPGPMLVSGDRDALYQVVVNLLNNAVTSEAEGRTLRIKVALETVDGTHEVRIRDNGCGMAPELADRIFTPFVSVRSHGTGLGMPIVQRMIADHDGKIELASTEGVGTTVTVRLPALETESAPAVAGPALRSAVTGQEAE